MSGIVTISDVERVIKLNDRFAPFVGSVRTSHFTFSMSKKYNAKLCFNWLHEG